MYYFEKPEEFDTFAEHWGFKVLKGDISLSDQNIFLRKFTATKENQEYISYMGVVRRLLKMNEELQERVTALEKHNSEQDKKLDESWDVMSDRIADLEKIYQQKGYYTKEELQKKAKAKR